MLRMEGTATPVVLAEGDEVRHDLHLLRVETDKVVLGNPASAVRSEITLYQEKSEAAKIAGIAAISGRDKPPAQAKDNKEVRKPIETHEI